MFSLNRIRIQKLILISILLFVVYVPPLIAAEKAELGSFDMSLEELLATDVSMGPLTSMELSKIPSAITIITREEIEKTPARNILDLLEVYVPGLMLFNDQNGGPTIKIRGLGIRNYKTLLLLNGRPVNQKAFWGSVIELRNWDMNDIERIEVHPPHLTRRSRNMRLNIGQRMA
jgi:outer membrane receptor for ferrienterochelin and colicin